MSKKLYAYGNGSFGCLYDHVSGPYDTQAEAADAAAELFELLDGGRDVLRRDGHLNLHEYRHTFIAPEDDWEPGADYVEVFEVDETWTPDGSEAE